jgi:ribosomal protein L18E
VLNTLLAVYIDNPYFKLFVFALVLWSAQLSPSTSILVALAFMMTMNYLNQKPVWEFLENTANDSPVAPSKDVAMNVAAGSLDQSMGNPESVQSVVQKTDTVVITPTIVDTPQGKQVVNPTVVVASLAVDTPQGTQMVKPDVTTVSISPQTPVQDIVPVPMIPQSQPQEIPTQISAESAPETRKCFPVRKADMSKVTAFDDEQEFKSL